MADFDSLVDDNESQSALPQSFDDLKDDKGTQPSFDALKEDSTPDYESPGQQALTVAEGAGQGFAGPIATGLELGMHKLGVDSDLGIDTSAEAQRARQQANPMEHGVAEAGALGAGLLTGVGEAGLISKGAAKLLPEATTALGKVGSSVVKGAIEGMALQTSDELSKAMLGEGDPETPMSSALAHIGGAGLLGGFAGGVFNAIGQGTTKSLAALENAKMGDKAANVLAGMGAAAKAHAAGVPEKEAEEFVTNYMRSSGVGPEFKYSDYAPGVKAYYSGIKSAVNKAADLTTNAASGGIGYTVAGIPGAYVGEKLSEKFLTPLVEKVLDKPLIGVTNKYVRPAVMYALSKGQTTGLFNVLNYATQMSKGAKAINNGVEALFKAGGQQALNAMMSDDRDKQRISDYVDEGGINKEMHDSLQVPSSDETPEQNYAQGGQVTDNDTGSLNNLYPAQSMLMSAARGRMSNYLGSLKPQKNPQKLPFDKDPDMKTKDRVYDNALNIAAAPLSILKHINDGTLQIEHIKHMNSMYPELTSHLQKKMTARIMKSQLDEEGPSGKTKQAMAMFLGAPLATYMTPQGILAAQSAFMPKQPQMPQPGQPQGKTKKGTSTLGKSNKTYQTASQAAESDRGSRD